MKRFNFDADGLEIERKDGEYILYEDHLTALKQSLAQPAQAAVPAGWQPIESAPKNGRTLLLGYFNELGKWRTVRGKWMSQEYIDEYWEDPDCGVPGWHETVVNSDDIPNCWYIVPTHWMLLPTPPAMLNAAPESGEG